MAQVVWTQTALDQLREIVDFVAQDSPANAEKIRLRLVQAPRKLETFPEMGALVPEFEAMNVRELLVKPFRVLYMVRGDRCHIAYIVRGSRDLGRLLKPEDFDDI